MRLRLVSFVGGLPASPVEVWVPPLEVPAVRPRVDADVPGCALPCAVRAEVTRTRCEKRRCVLGPDRPGRRTGDLTRAVCGLDDGASDDLTVGVDVDDLDVVSFDAEGAAAVDRSDQKAPVDLVDRDSAPGHTAPGRVGVAAFSTPAEHELIFPADGPLRAGTTQEPSRSADLARFVPVWVERITRPARS